MFPDLPPYLGPSLLRACPLVSMCLWAEESLHLLLLSCLFYPVREIPCQLGIPRLGHVYRIAAPPHFQKKLLKSTIKLWEVIRKFFLFRRIIEKQFQLTSKRSTWKLFLLRKKENKNTSFYISYIYFKLHKTTIIKFPSHKKHNYDCEVTQKQTLDKYKK